jgi:hypothetical protein
MIREASVAGGAKGAARKAALKRNGTDFTNNFFVFFTLIHLD